MEEYECLEYDDGVVKRVSTNCLYSIQINKEKAVEKINNELQNLDFAGLYLLIDSFNKRIYTGESSNIKDRIQQHIKNPELPDFEFDKVIVIWDGRPITTTRFGDETLRKSLEKVCIGSFDPNSSKYKSVNTVTKPKKTNIYEEFSNNRFKKELVFLLYKYGLIHTRPSEN